MDEEKEWKEREEDEDGPESLCIYMYGAALRVLSLLRSRL